MQQVPRIADRVRLPGYDIPFFVVTVHEDDKTVDLIPVSGLAPCLNDVPIAKLLDPGSATHSESYTPCI